MEISDICSGLHMVKLIQETVDSERFEAFLKSISYYGLDELFWYVYEFIDACCDFTSLDYLEAYENEKVFFSTEEMREYLYLANQYGKKHHISRKKNPYIQRAKAFICFELSEVDGIGYWFSAKEEDGGVALYFDQNYGGYDTPDVLHAVCNVIKRFRGALPELKNEILQLKAKEGLMKSA